MGKIITDSTYVFNQFTIVDDAIVGEEDYETNFFVERPSGDGGDDVRRADMVRNLLVEMNPDVRGNSSIRNVQRLIREEPKWFSQFTLVVATQLEEESLKLLGEACANSNVPLVVARTYGLMGHVRLYLREHCVVESKPSPEPQPDLRIANPFPELTALAASIDLEALPYHEYKHVPYVLILVKLMEEWRRRHDGAAPSTTPEKEEFRRSVKAMSKKGWGDEENLVEAFANAYLAYVPRRIPDELQTWMLDARAEECATPFWVMMRALRDFVGKTQSHLLPVCSTLPDMTATTGMYVSLQRCYKDRATKDFEAFSAIVEELVKGKPQKNTAVSPTLEERQVFCANAVGIAVLRYRSPREEFERPNVDHLRDYVFSDPDMVGDSQLPFYWYLLWRGCDAVYASTGKYPAQDPALDENPGALETAARELLSVTHAIVARNYGGVIGLNPASLTIDMAREMVRYGASREIHNVSALVGGVASQESVKLLTGQYIPLQNTWFFNGISGVGGVYEL